MSDERSAILASAAWSAMVTASAEPARFRRGRQYLRDNAVVELDVLPGQLIGEVQGSRASAYEVVIAVPQLPGAADLTAVRLTPAATDVRYRCTCPDWESPCKHAVAVALAFGERLRVAPDELVRLRTGREGSRPEPVAPVERRPPPSAAAPARHLRVVHSGGGPVEPPPLSAEVVAFLGEELSTDSPEPPELVPPVIPAARIGAVDVGALVADAHSWLAQAFTR